MVVGVFGVELVAEFLLGLLSGFGALNVGLCE